jgi:hypothetical protein
VKIQIKGISGGKDRRGLVSLTFRYLFTQTTVDEALTGELPTKPTSLPEVGRKFVEWDVDNHGFLIDVSFEGIINEPGKEEEQYLIVGEWREERIEAFPKRQELIEKYGAYEEDGLLKFPQYLPAKGQGSGSFQNTTKSKGELNPLFGTTSYPVLRLVATQTMVRERVPASVFSEVGNVVKKLPAGFQDPPKRVWIVDTPQVRRRGNTWEIVRRWKEVDNLKHLEALYLLLGKSK